MIRQRFGNEPWCPNGTEYGIFEIVGSLLSTSVWARDGNWTSAIEDQPFSAGESNVHLSRAKLGIKEQRLRAPLDSVRLDGQERDLLFGPRIRKGEQDHEVGHGPFRLKLSLVDPEPISAVAYRRETICGRFATTPHGESLTFPRHVSGVVGPKC